MTTVPLSVRTANASATDTTWVTAPGTCTGSPIDSNGEPRLEISISLIVLELAEMTATAFTAATSSAPGWMPSAHSLPWRTPPQAAIRPRAVMATKWVVVATS